MREFTLLARLLDYPDQELVRHWEELRNFICGPASFSAEERQALLALLDWMQGQPLVDLQAFYVQTFDMQAEHSLHLTHHLFGDDRGRGPALVDLGEHYKANGLQADTRELPDYLPLILEYVSTLDPLAAGMFLADAAKVLTVLGDNLAAAASPYASLVRMVERRSHLAHCAA